MDQGDPQWLTWTKRLQAIAQSGLTFTRDHYDHERYEQLQRIAAEMMAAGSGIFDSQKVLDLFRQEHGYATPKVEVRGAVFRDGEILLVRERDDGGWTVPGGWADVGEAPSAMAVREIKEESGFDVVARKLVAIYDRNQHPHPPNPHHSYKIVFLCDLIGGEATPSFETPGILSPQCPAGAFCRPDHDAADRTVLRARRTSRVAGTLRLSKSLRKESVPKGG